MVPATAPPPEAPMDIGPIVELLKDSDPDVVIEGLREMKSLYHSSTRYRTLILQGNLKTLVVRHAYSVHEDLVASAVGVLWNFSAWEENKEALVDAGAIPAALRIIGAEHNYNDEHIMQGAVAILSNLSEYRFDSGAYNQRQKKVLKHKPLRVLQTVLGARNRKSSTEFLLCLTTVNLLASRNTIRRRTEKRCLDNVEKFRKKMEANGAGERISYSWITYMPMVALLHSKIVEVIRFGLCSLAWNLQESQAFERKVHKSVALTGSWQKFCSLAKCEDKIISTKAAEILKRFHVNESVLPSPVNHLAVDMGGLLCSDTLGTSDQMVNLLVDGSSIPVHKAILWARVPQFRSDIRILSSEITLSPDVSATAAAAVVRYLYTNDIQLTCSNFKDIRVAAKWFDLKGLERECVNWRKQCKSVSQCMSVNFDGVYLK